MNPVLEELTSQFVTPAPHMREIGLQVVDIGEGRGTLRLPASPRWLGDAARGLLHPGPLTVLADSACGLAVGAAIKRRLPFATLDLRMDLLRPAGPDADVSCEAECYQLTRSVAFTRATLWQADRQVPIANAQATFMLSTAPGTRPTTPLGVSAPVDPPGASATEAALAPWTAPTASAPVVASQPMPYVEFLGIRSAEGDPPLFRLPYEEKLIGNPRLPALHGGVVAAFAETAATLHLIRQLSQHSGGAKQPKPIDFSIDYLRSGRPIETFASSEIVRLGARVALVQTRCWQKSPDYPIAVTRGHFLLTEEGA